MGPSALAPRLGIEDALDAEDDVVGRHLAPVVELRPPDEMEGPDGRAGAGLPALGELGPGFQVLVHARQVREDRLRQHVAVAGRGVRGVEARLHAGDRELEHAAALLRGHGRGEGEHDEGGDGDGEPLAHDVSSHR